ncbi:GAF domain-containing protein [Erysipelothrix larvae]
MIRMDYKLLIEQAQSLCESEPDAIANMANLSALLNEMMADLNWVGFYIYKENALVLGPFQGKVACTRLPHGKGVCMAALESNQTLKVDDVHAFPGHIACDSASKSELVVPIYNDGEPFGVLDIDAPIENRFSQDDVDGLTLLIETIKSSIVL